MIENNKGMHLQRITPSLWFDGNAKEAVNFYVSLFKNSQIKGMAYYGEAGPMEKGTVMTVDFELNGQPFLAINAGPEFKFSPAISFMVNCETQQEVDELWEKLTDGGQEEDCGWLRDKYGLSWQIVPNVLGALMQDKDPEKARRVTEAMFRMKKLDIKTLQEA